MIYYDNNSDEGLASQKYPVTLLVCARYSIRVPFSPGAVALLQQCRGAEYNSTTSQTYTITYENIFSEIHILLGKTKTKNEINGFKFCTLA